MKITIESSELKHLQDEVERYKEDLREAEERLKQLDEKEIEKKIISLSWRLFENYITAVFNSLGFDDPKWRGSIDFENSLKYNQDWYKNPDMYAYVSAHVSEHFREAFLKIGVTDRPQKKKTLIEELENQ